LATEAGQIDDMLSSSSTGLTATLQAFANSIQTLSTSPSSTASGQAVLSQAQTLVQQLRSYDSQLSQIGTQLESQISSSVTQINTISGQIATLNGEISAQTISGQAPNELEDQRDELISNLSKLVTVNTVTEANGAVDVYIGSGQALVTGSTAQQLTTVPSAYDASALDVGLTNASGTTDITSEVSGGSLGGLLAARSQALTPAENGIGRISVTLATLVNQQQQAGMDLTGAQGQKMLSVGGVQVLASSANSDTTSVTATRTTLSGLTTDDYVLRYTGTAWQLTDQATGANVAFSGTGTSTDPIEAAGLSIVVKGVGAGDTVASGDSFLIRPTAGATAGLSVLLTSPSQIASASLIQATAASGNTGQAAVSSALITDYPTWAAATAGPPYTISFTSPTQYTVTSGGSPVISGTYTSGDPITFNGAAVTLTGTPATGDSFTVGANSPANTGDNSNA
ncbi:MAG: FlgK family flagellar hook-associated protein, partial [Solirubrobacteraceae bacterium]